MKNKQTFSITEDEVRHVVHECVHQLLIKEINDNQLGPIEDNGNEEDYDPWMNGDASYIDGSYDIPYGFHVDIDSSMSTVSIEDNKGNDENSYFLQGDEADDLIKQIAQYWSNNDCTQDEAVNAVIRGLF